MSKRELNISDKKLYIDTKEDIILKSPFKIPPKGLQNIKILKEVKITDYAYYDIAQSENQSIHWKWVSPRIFYEEGNYPNTEEMHMIMGNFEDI
tara:strand:- start:3292 stop:3573 length:282 start_codon:yes stop_codon:yes gene_type:complete